MAQIYDNLDEEFEALEQAIEETLDQLEQALVNQQEAMGEHEGLIHNWLERVIYFIETGLGSAEPMITPDRYTEFITACHEGRVQYREVYLAKPCLAIMLEQDSDKQNKILAVIDTNTGNQLL